MGNVKLHRPYYSDPMIGDLRNQLQSRNINK